MRGRPPSVSGRVLAVLAAVLVLKVGAAIVSRYPDYLPPDFRSDFLRGREHDFQGVYPWAFYAHIVSGPVALALGLVLVSGPVRNKFPAWHRRLGRVQVACVLLLVAPSGLGMAFFAAAGPVAGVGLAGLAVATAATAALGTRAAVRRRFADHRRWMWRCYLLLVSSVVLRLLSGLATVAGVSAPWFDPLAVWVSWLAPVAAFEGVERWRRGTRTRGRAGYQSSRFGVS